MIKNIDLKQLIETTEENSDILFDCRMLAARLVVTFISEDGELATDIVFTDPKHERALKEIEE